MTKSRFTKISALVLALALALGALTCIGVSAEETNAKAEISSINVEHRDMMHLAFKIEYNGVVYTGAEETDGTVGVMVWAPDTAECTVQNKIHVSYELKYDGKGTYYYASHGIAAKYINSDFFVAVVEKDAEGNVSIISEITTFSIKGWAETKLTQTTDAAKLNLYNKVLAYGNAAAGVFN